VRVTPDGEVQVVFRGNPLVTVRGEGEVVLDTAGHHNGTVLGVLKRALRPMGVRLTAQTENFAEDWSVEDGTNFSRFQDGMVLRPMGTLTKARAAKLLRAHNHPSADDFEARVGIPLGGVAGHSGRGRGSRGRGRGRGGFRGGARGRGSSRGRGGGRGGGAAYQLERKLEAQGRAEMDVE